MRVVVDNERLKPGVVYVVPSDHHVEITDHLVRLSADRAYGGRRPKPSVNRSLTSAARTYGERLIAVILTGTGSDGASGARGEGSRRHGHHRKSGDRRVPWYARVAGADNGGPRVRSAADWATANNTANTKQYHTGSDRVAGARVSARRGSARRRLCRRRLGRV